MEKYDAPPIPYGGPGAFAIHAAAGVEYGEGFAGNAHRHAPDGWLTGDEVSRRGARRRRQRARQRRLHAAPSRRRARRQRDDPVSRVSKGADVKAVARSGQTTADMANGPVQRLSADSGDDRAADEARLEEQQSLRYLLGQQAIRPTGHQ